MQLAILPVFASKESGVDCLCLRKLTLTALFIIGLVVVALWLARVILKEK
jgi:hypothetical protein